ncbi:hypothetical protein [Hydrogenophaga sp.]|uniref:hypothetical protein n=1 Tax=Hydrogenophaga sp. TaxID=1904254 RepID=UPI00271FE61D|nr:hypothetical protein [Hydrogenophaga sp.]MDO9437657.1 hypothetical protein [Hydrogenophaga sp.]
MTGFRDRLNAMVSPRKTGSAPSSMGKSGSSYSSLEGAENLKSRGSDELEAALSSRKIKVQNPRYNRIRKEIRIAFGAADQELLKLVHGVKAGDPTAATSACREFANALYPLRKEAPHKRPPSDVQIQGNRLTNLTNSMTLAELEDLNRYMDDYLLNKVPDTAIPNNVITHLAISVKSAMLDCKLQAMRRHEAPAGTRTSDFQEKIAESYELAVLLNKAATLMPNSVTGKVSGMHFSRNELKNIEAQMFGNLAKSVNPLHPVAAASATTAATAIPARAAVWVAASPRAAATGPSANTAAVAAASVAKAQDQARSQAALVDLSVGDLLLALKNGNEGEAHRNCIMIDLALAPDHSTDARDAVQVRRDPLLKAVNAMGTLERNALNDLLNEMLSTDLPLGLGNVLKHLALLVKIEIFYGRISDFDDQGVDLESDFPDYSKLTDADRIDIAELRGLALEVKSLRDAYPETLENSAMDEIRAIASKLGQAAKSTEAAAQSVIAAPDTQNRSLEAGIGLTAAQPAVTASQSIDQVVSVSKGSPSPSDTALVKRKDGKRPAVLPRMAVVKEVRNLIIGLREGNASSINEASAKINAALSSASVPSAEAAIRLRHECLGKVTSGMEPSKLLELHLLLDRGLSSAADPSLRDVTQHLSALVKFELLLRGHNARTVPSAETATRLGDLLKLVNDLQGLLAGYLSTDDQQTLQDVANDLHGRVSAPGATTVAAETVPQAVAVQEQTAWRHATVDLAFPLGMALPQALTVEEEIEWLSEKVDLPMPTRATPTPTTTPAAMATPVATVVATPKSPQIETPLAASVAAWAAASTATQTPARSAKNVVSEEELAVREQVRRFADALQAPEAFDGNRLQAIGAQMLRIEATPQARARFFRKAFELQEMDHLVKVSNAIEELQSSFINEQSPFGQLVFAIRTAVGVTIFLKWTDRIAFDGVDLDVALGVGVPDFTKMSAAQAVLLPKIRALASTVLSKKAVEAHVLSSVEWADIEDQVQRINDFSTRETYDDEDEIFRAVNSWAEGKLSR